MRANRRITALLVTAFLLLGMLPAHGAQAAGENTLVCVIDQTDAAKVAITANLETGIPTDDGRIYLFCVPTYVDSIAEQTPVASLPYNPGQAHSFTLDLRNNTAQSLLYSKFYAGVRVGGKYTPVTGGSFITNPERVSPACGERVAAASKKGIHMTLSIPTDVEELGIKQGYFNIVFADFISNTPTEISHTYNGKTYYYTSTVNDYDVRIGNMTKAGIAITISLLNEYREGYEYLLHPGVSRRDGTVNYAVNTSTPEGLETVAAAVHFLAERYNGGPDARGKVDNWILGNEVNDNLQYYYMGPQNADTFVQEYLQSFRVFYTAVKSGCGNANVYICLQHRWNTEDSTGDYGGKGFLDKFSAYARAQGDIDWGLSYHPYSFPMNDADILNDGKSSVDQYGNSVSAGAVTNSVSTPIITMKNISVLTDYFHNSHMRNPRGEIRSILLGEQGYTSYSNITGQNEVKQAANIALAYYIAEMNKDVDAFLLRCHCDEDEGTPYFKFGIRNANETGAAGTEKFAYTVYKYIDTPQSLEYTEFAKVVLNITDWAQAVPGWNPAVFAEMGQRTEGVLYMVTGTSDIEMIADVMLDKWETGWNVFDIGPFDYEPVHYPGGTAVANSFAYYMDYQVIKNRLDSPLNLAEKPYLVMDVHFKPMEAGNAGQELEVKIRLRSGNDVFDGACILLAGEKETLCLDLSAWEGRKALDEIQVMVRQHGESQSFAGTFTVYNTRAASEVSGKSPMPVMEKKTNDLSSAQLSYQKNFRHTGNAIEPQVTVKLAGDTLTQHRDYDVIYHDNVAPGNGKIVVVGIGNYAGVVSGTFTIEGNYPTIYDGVDYAPVYSYGYYLENNPMAVREVGTDPEALLKHFVTKGMRYALQGIGDFNVLAYAKMNGDLRPHLGDDWAAYYMHYLKAGIEEGRTISGIQPEDMQPPVYPCTNHAEKELAAVAPGCVTDGLTRGSYCEFCGQTIVAQRLIPPPGHIYSGDTDVTCDTCGTVRELYTSRPTVNMFRMYDPNSGEHFYTGSAEERDFLVSAGWQYEGVGFTFPLTTGDPVYRLYDRVSGEHLYTMDKAEKDRLLAEGWNYEGIAFNSGFDTEVPQYRLHNPNATRGAYHFTASIEERDFLISIGWEYQGIGWYSCWS